MFIDDTNIRVLAADDVQAAGEILYQAYASAYRDHGLLEPIADAAQAMAVVRDYADRDGDEILVAEKDGRLVGVGCVHRRGNVASLGPLAISPRAQGQRIGKRLLARLIERAQASASVRAFVDAFNSRAIGLAVSAGFSAADTGTYLAALGGLRGPGRMLGLRKDPVRALTDTDLEQVVSYDANAFGGARPTDIGAAFERGQGLTVESDGRLAGYLFGRVEESLGMIGPGAAEDAELLAGLLARIGDELRGANILRTCLVASQRDLLNHALEMGFRVTSSAVYMTKGAASDAFAKPRVVGLPADVV